MAAVPAPVAMPAEEDEHASLLIANATAATPVAAPPATQTAPLARPKAPTMTAPLAAPTAAQPTALQPRPAPAAAPKSSNLLTKGFVPTQQAIAAATADRKAAHPAAEQHAPATDAPFIAPAPAEPMFEAPAPAFRAKAASADPFAEAAFTNGARAPQKPMPLPPLPQRMTAEPEPTREPAKERSSGLDLFKRVTGLASLRRQPTVAKPASVAPSAMPATPAKAEMLVKESPRTAPPMGGLNPADRPQAARQEDDLLDIPAFLRRQAN
jgi:cell division protein FtsZ